MCRSFVTTGGWNTALAPARSHAPGLIKKVGRTDKDYLTHTGQQGVVTALTLRELVVIPSLAGLLPAA